MATSQAGYKFDKAESDSGVDILCRCCTNYHAINCGDTTGATFELNGCKFYDYFFNNGAYGCYYFIKEENSEK